MNWVGDFLSGPIWPMAFVLIYPIVAVIALEASRGAEARNAFFAGVLRQAVYGLLPTGAIWLILTRVAEFPPENVVARCAQTGFALTALYLVLKLVQALLAWMIGDEQRAPKLLLDTVRVGIAMLWGAVVVSRIWNIDLGSLIAAMGVGSIVLGFALQEFLGNLLSGLGLLSANKFKIGDWLIVDGRPQKVVAFDWRSATLIDSGGAQTVVANSTLAKGNLVIASRAGEAGWLQQTLTLGLDIPPEEARAAILEAAAAVPGLPPGMAPRCFVTDISNQRVSYLALLPIPAPGASSGPKDEFLSRFWYVAQRRGLRLTDPSANAPPELFSGQRAIAESGALRRYPYLIESLGPLRRYRRGDVLLKEGEPADEAFVVSSGALAVLVPGGAQPTRLETLGAGQLLVLPEAVTGAASPLRLVADSHAEVVPIPRAALAAAIRDHADLARDIGALAESRRQALAALQRSLARTGTSKHLAVL